MNDDDKSHGGLWAILIAVPVMVICCAGPLLFLPLLAALRSWFSGVNILAAIVIALAVALAVAQFAKSRRCKLPENQTDLD